MAVQQITIIGLGLIGGSFALALKEHAFSGRIVGCDRAAVLGTALDRRMIDAAAEDPVEACRGSAVVLLATPVSSILDLIERLGPVIERDTLLTDTGSTKRAIADRAQSVFGAEADARFLAGHPIAGRETSGIGSASDDLFGGSTWVLCGKPHAAAEPFIELVEMVGASVAYMSSAEHDHVLARTSHLPQLLATALASQLGQELTSGEFSAFAGRGLRDMTRLAESSYEIWRDIALTNGDEIDRALLAFEQNLAHIRENLRTRELRGQFRLAAGFREALRKADSDQ